MAATDTEIHLQNWRSGSTEAERLAAAILHLEGYRDIEPQAPLGGPDGRKDILCDRGGRGWLGAVYFPSLVKDFADIQAKFLHDLEGVSRHRRQGIVFLTNQRLKISEREELVGVALHAGCECTIYDVERIRGVLDVPEGYGVRIAFLRTPMTLDEQLAFFARRENTIENAMERNTNELRKLGAKIASIQASQRVVAQTMASFANQSGLDPSLLPLRTIDPLALGDLRTEPDTKLLSQELSPELLLLVHRLIGFELPSRMIGRYRKEAVHLGMPGVLAPPSALQPPPPSKVPMLVAELCDNWRKELAGTQTEIARLTAVARFHQQFLLIHPFLDGNGRVARALLLQQCLDLFGHADMSRFDRGAPYLEALSAADSGNLERLTALIRPVVAE